MTIKTNGTQKESKVIEVERKPTVLLHYDVDYDSTKPEETIRQFVKAIEGMISKFEYNRERVVEIEAEENDLNHYIEISGFKSAPDANRLYRKHKELLMERRACKNENDLLQPIYEYFHATEVLKKLRHVQGECTKAHEAIDDRTYAVRTDILKDWLEPKKKELAGVGLDLNTGETCGMNPEPMTAKIDSRQIWSTDEDIHEYHNDDAVMEIPGITAVVLDMKEIERDEAEKPANELNDRIQKEYEDNRKKFTLAYKTPV